MTDQNEQNRQPGQQMQQGQQGVERQQNQQNLDQGQGQGADNTNRTGDEEQDNAEAGLDNELGDAGEEDQE